MRWVLGVAALLLLGSDVMQDIDYWPHATTAMQAALVFRNLLMLAAVAALFLERVWSPLVLVLVALLGLVRRALYLAPTIPNLLNVKDPFYIGFHSGADLLFRFVLLAVAVELFLRLKKES